MRLPTLLTLVLAADAKKHHRNATRWSPRAEFLKRHGPLTGQEAVEAELARSLRDFAKPQSVDETRAVLKRLLSPDLRNKAAFIYENELYVTKQFLSADKNEGLACMVESAKKRGHAFPTVAWVHNKGASGGDAGTCTKGVEYSIPTTVIAKRDGYAQCGILLPNPYFGENPLKGGMGDLNRWDRVRASIQRASLRSSLERRDSRAFWRGRCYSNERELAPPVTVCRPRKGFVNALLGRKKCHTHKERREYLACHFKKGAGNRARLLAAALTATRPDLFDAKCNALDPPRNFSCTRDVAALEAALRVVDAVPGRVLDPEHYEKEAYARHSVMLHLPGQTVRLGVW